MSYGKPRGTLQQPKIWALKASSSDKDKPWAKEFLTLLWVNLSTLFFFTASSSLALSIKAAIWFVSTISFFSNSEDCRIWGSISSGFCFFLTICFFSFFSSGKGILSGFSFAFAAGGACSETTLFYFSLTFSITFLALGAYGIFVSSDIWINSTETIGGKSIGCLVINGKLKIVKSIISAWNVTE